MNLWNMGSAVFWPAHMPGVALGCFSRLGVFQSPQIASGINVAMPPLIGKAIENIN
jgi:hypothetical protein